jgi:hypothetical protein
MWWHCVLFCNSLGYKKWSFLPVLEKYVKFYFFDNLRSTSQLEEFDHSPMSSADVKNEGYSTSTQCPLLCEQRILF